MPVTMAAGVTWITLEPRPKQKYGKQPHAKEPAGAGMMPCTFREAV